MDAKTDPKDNLTELWHSTLAILKEQIPGPSFRTWLQNTRLREINVGKAGMATAAVAVPSAFAAEWLRGHYDSPIAAAVKIGLGRPVRITFIVEAPTSHRAIRALDGIIQLHQREQAKQQQLPMAAGQSRPIGTRSAQSQSSNAKTRSPQVQPEWAPALTGSNTSAVRAPLPVLNPGYTFDRFLVCRGNQLGASVGRRVAEEPGVAYNPLFIYGHHGAGKSHLLHAIGNDAYGRKTYRVLCVPATLFENSEVAAKLASPASMGGLDLLLIDDLHQIAGVNGRHAQQWLAIVIEGMLAAGKGVVVTALQPPDSMLALRENLLSRLRQGMVVALELPDAEMKLRMVRNLAERSGKPIDHHALQLLASSRSNLPALISLWERLVARFGQAKAQESHRQTGVLTTQDVQAVLEDVGPEIDLRSHVGPEGIIDQVTSYFDLETNEICSFSRERRVMFPRQIAMYLIREQTDSSYEWIAHRFARQDHTTAMYSCARIAALSISDPEVRQTVLELRQMVFGEHERISSLAVSV